jgi:predicted nucleotide-binding protein (sugar kinase/HSP70/actin superfamily)
MLRVTFPHIGNSYIPFRTLLTELGLDPVIPPFISQRTIALGTKMAPEFACFPLKVNLGNFIEAIEMGADAIFMAGGVGPCRFGYYGELQRQILREKGYDLEFLVLEAPKTHPMELWEKIKRYFPRHHLPDIIRAISLAWLKANTLDSFDRYANRIRPLVERAELIDDLQDRFYNSLDQVFLAKDIKRIGLEALEELKAMVIRVKPQPLRIVLLGEIYMVLEPRVNFQIERMLGALGVEVFRTIYFTDWVRDQLVFSIIRPDWRKKLSLLADPYLGNFVGGHGLETVAHTVEAGVNRYDGVVELAPFTCMPEIVAMQALPTISHELSIPVLPLIIDEHSGEAGVKTRVEAFVDLLARKNRRSISKLGGRKLEALSGY